MERAPPRPGRSPWLHLALFAATAVTTLLSGAAAAPLPEGTELTAWLVLREGWPFAAALLAILGAHEMGHYVAARLHGVDATLPYFLPGIPFAGPGTFGAVMRVRGPLPSRRAVLDVGAAGPIAGFAVALPLLWLGLARSTPVDAGALPGGGPDSLVGLLWALWQGLPTPEPTGTLRLGDSLVLRGVQRLAFGPLPEGQELLLHPVAYAAWFGMLVTLLNLFPIGQLDGGHVAYALLGPGRAARLSRVASWALLGCGLALSAGWLGWWLVTRLAARPHPRALDERPLDGRRVAVALLSLALFVLTFVPVPISS